MKHLRDRYSLKRLTRIMRGPFITIFVGDSGGFVAHVTVFL